jgi:hypothetical protein
MLLIWIVVFYLVVGACFSIPFLTRWIVMVDESARETSCGFKILILPGCIVFWPVLLRKIIQLKKKNRPS